MACTGIELISRQGNPYWARTQDFEQHFEYAGVKLPKGYTFVNAYTPFASERNVMGIVWAKDIHHAPVFLDGINEYGLCGGTFYFDHFYRYVPTEVIKASGKTAIRGEELCTWILTHYKSLDDIKVNLGRDIGITTEPGPMMGMSVPQHCVMHDETGRSIVIEPSVENGFQIFENPLGVFTNAPTFDWHLNNLKTWLERTTKRTYSYDVAEPIAQIKLSEPTSGLVGIPADYKPESRFLRAAMSKLMSVEVNDDEALNQAYQLLTAVNTPKGSLRIGEGDDTLVAWTQYTAGYDIKQKMLYAFTYDNRDLRSLSYGDPADWGSDIRYFSFISKQTARPFDEKNEWQPGENTI
ncbi:linear amide C-N hydrolase, choloylglycine hydrolase family protein [Secundilactobacillus odoratitofui DSM 19909 = JCM 15043]|uniref:Linear amide C-N hydrolase, choloylglycine hydrolase family protein n=1 Tax=Secundilactobacillus odoratitofui DSM 19909 = JCM 15043 TaxID=1423776 RepID=A0A0R1LT33_9LACO|nr:linear amide C-N hydrolase [Secundilactobacillus odoratitofui]KRK98799.1 linear amide C-N hydrolase, choloylglycine hydrolase family protein [Secundilactobacillus odoratitofui DSM 19909 = JCM 15043]